MEFVAGMDILEAELHLVKKFEQIATARYDPSMPHLLPSSPRVGSPIDCPHYRGNRFAVYHSLVRPWVVYLMGTSVDTITEGWFPHRLPSLSGEACPHHRGNHFASYHSLVPLSLVILIGGIPSYRHCFTSPPPSLSLIEFMFFRNIRAN